MNYTGTLVDATTGQPIAGATISITHAAAQGLTIEPALNMPRPIAITLPPMTMTGTDTAVGETTANGQFNISAPTGVFDIIFTKVGYYPVSVRSVDVAALPASTIEMQPGSAETLEAVVITPQLKWVLGAAAISAILYYSFKK